MSTSAEGSDLTRDIFGNIWLACEFGDTDQVDRYIRSGKDINARNPDDETPLLSATGCGHINIVKMLLASASGRACDVNARDNTGNTSLMRALEYGYDFLLDLFLEYHADVNIANNNGNTPLMAVSRHGQEPLVKALVKAGADPTAMNDAGNTALSIAVKHGNFLTARFLASISIPDGRFPYSGAPISLIIPKRKVIDAQNHSEFVRSVVPLYTTRSVEDCAFGAEMQRDIENIFLGDHTNDGIRRLLTEQDANLLTKLRAILRSIDHSRSGRENEEVPDCDIEL